MIENSSYDSPARSSHTGSTKGQYLRLHQPHDGLGQGPHQAPQKKPTHETADPGAPTANRHELAGVVGKVSCRLRQHAASATMHCGMLARRLTGDPRNMNILNEVMDAVRALESLVDGLADYAADQPPHCETVSLSRLVHEVLDAMQDRLKRQQVIVEINVPKTLSAECDRRMLGAAVRNLAASALTAMPAGGQLVVTAVATSQGIEIEVADSGPGLTEVDLPRAFTPLRHAQAGASGLELAIAEHVATAHGGQATARNCPEGGAALTLFIPWRRTQQAVA